MKKTTYICDKCKKELEAKDLCTVRIKFSELVAHGTKSRYEDKVIDIEVCSDCRNDILSFIGKDNFEIRTAND